MLLSGLPPVIALLDYQYVAVVLVIGRMAKCVLSAAVLYQTRLTIKGTSVLGGNGKWHSNSTTRITVVLW